VNISVSKRAWVRVGRQSGELLGSVRVYNNRIFQFSCVIIQIRGAAWPGSFDILQVLRRLGTTLPDRCWLRLRGSGRVVRVRDRLILGSVGFGVAVAGTLC
jgi:hypothetical protein